MKLARFLYHQIRDHVLEAAPREACGLVAVLPVTDVPVHVFRCSNVAALPHEAYRIDADDQKFALWAMEQDGWRLGAIYHSHPRGRSTPSLTDLEAACPDGKVLWPGVVHIIVGVPDLVREGMIHDPEARLVTQAWRLEPNGAGVRVEQEPLELWP